MLSSQSTEWRLLFLVSASLLMTSVVAQNYTYKTYFFEEPIDHFSFHNQGTFMLKYLVNDDYWSGAGAPIFVYTGNEGEIEMFLHNSGFMFDIAPQFNALLVFAEHRYYGVSLPFGNASYDLDKFGYLSSRQALGDYANLLTHIKSTFPGAQNSPVITFGGSYGAILAAWARVKYPHIFTGAISSSGPILQFLGLTPCNTFFEIVTKLFHDVTPTCSDTIRRSWDALNAKNATSAGQDWLTKTFHLCQPLRTDSDLILLKVWLRNTWTRLAMTNYPYAANFLQPLPAWPVVGACTFLNGTYHTDEEVLQAVANAAFFYSNYSGQTPCSDISEDMSPRLGYFGWAYQSCTEIVMPMCTDGIHDMFEPETWDLAAYAADCQETWLTTVHPYMPIIEYGGRDLVYSSNIVFSNGDLDPWASGGVLENISDTVVAILIEGAAHHLDIRASNPNDPPSVVKARAAEVTYIQKWIEEHYNHKAMAAYKKQKYSMFNNTGSSIKDILFNTV